MVGVDMLHCLDPLKWSPMRPLKRTLITVVPDIKNKKTTLMIHLGAVNGLSELEWRHRCQSLEDQGVNGTKVDRLTKTDG